MSATVVRFPDGARLPAAKRNLSSLVRPQRPAAEADGPFQMTIWHEGLIKALVAAQIRESDLWVESRKARKHRKEIEARLIRISNRA